MHKHNKLTLHFSSFIVLRCGDMHCAASSCLLHTLTCVNSVVFAQAGAKQGRVLKRPLTPTSSPPLALYCTGNFARFTPKQTPFTLLSNSQRIFLSDFRPAPLRCLHPHFSLYFPFHCNTTLGCSASPGQQRITLHCALYRQQKELQPDVSPRMRGKKRGKITPIH